MKKIIIASITGILVLSIGAIWYSRRPGIDYVPVRRGNIEEAVYGLGKVKSRKVYELKLGVVGSIQHLYVKEGDSVKKGAPLVRFDGGSAFNAPFDGTVTAAPFHEGENVFPQTVALRLEDLSDLYVEVVLEQQGALRVKKRQDAQLSFESLRGTPAHGKVTAVYPRDDQFVVRIESDKIPSEVFPGMSADVSVKVGQKENVLLVPIAAVTNGRLTASRAGKKRKATVSIGASDETWAEVVTGDLTEEDEVATPKR